MNAEPYYKLVRWETPFADAEYPAVYIIADEGGDSRDLTVIVAPDGIDRYPKYIIRFRAVYAYKSEEEARWFTPDKQPEHRPIAPDIKCSALCLSGSVWWDAYGWQVREYSNVEPTHFFLFGGDNDVEVFAALEPSVERIDRPTTLTLTFAV